MKLVLRIETMLFFTAHFREEVTADPTLMTSDSGADDNTEGTNNPGTSGVVDDATTTAPNNPGTSSVVDDATTAPPRKYIHIIC